MSAIQEFKLSSEHYQRLHKRLQDELERSDLDVVTIISPENIVYFAGIFVPTHRSIPERLYIALFAKGRNPSLIACKNVEAPVRLLSQIKDINIYVEFKESPIETLVDLMKQSSLQRGKIGIELDFLTVIHYQELLRLLPKIEFVNCSEFLARIRMIKDQEEVNLLKELALLTEKSIEEAYKLARPNDTVESLKRNAISAIGRFGADHINFCLFELRSAGQATTEDQSAKMGTQNIKTEALLSEGDLFNIDLSGNFGGYMSDLMRLAIVGKPQKKLLEAYKKYMRLQRQIIETMEPGKRMCDIFEFYQRRFTEEGLIPRTGSHIGHSIGTRHHEYPMISSLHQEQLVPNMVLNVEPVGIIPDLGGSQIQVEDTILITEDKPELMSTYADTNKLYTIE